MKKKLVVLMAGVMALALVACGNADTQNEGSQMSTGSEVYEESTQESVEESTEETTEESTEESTEEVQEAANGVMTYAEYVAAELDTEVVVETYVQANQSWWDGKITVYSQDEDGAYFLYNMACESQEEADKLVPGTKIRVTGYKSEWSGEVEIVDATYEIIEGSYIAEAADVTDLLKDAEALIEKQNQFVSFTGMTVESEAIYKWDGSGSEGDDLYFNVSYDGETYSFTVESYLCGADTEVYKAVKNLKKGDVVDMTGFLYWYEGVNPHITSVTVK